MIRIESDAFETAYKDEFPNCRLTSGQLRRWHAVKDASKQSPALPRLGGHWFAGKSSTRIAKFWMRLRNSSGSESKVSSATLTKSPRFITHSLTRSRSPATSRNCSEVRPYSGGTGTPSTPRYA